ncbi:MAG: TonB-dependent receptor [Gammaproteobacteria bacterium]|nr:TonB-dependent receptor [Gammaproteobacteria bacterium]
MPYRLRCFTLLLILIACNAFAAEEAWRGKALGEYISHLAAQGLKVIYSDDLVRSDYIVRTEPTSRDPIESLREILGTYHLSIVTGPGGTWLITQDAAAVRGEPATRAASEGQRLLPEIIVSSSVYSVRYPKTGSHVFLDREYTAGLPDVGEEALRPLDRLPGIANGGISARSHIRGGAENEQLIVFDGLRLYEPYHLKDFQTAATTIDQSAIDGIDFYTAGYQARYGDRMSGVIDIQMRKPSEITETELGLSLFNSWVLSTGRFSTDGRGDWLVSARRSNLDLLARALNQDYGSPQFGDILSHVGWKLTDRTYLAANFLYSFDRIELSQADDSEIAAARYRNRVGWLKAETDWSGAISSTTILSVTDIANVRDGQTNLPDVMRGEVDDRRDFRSYALSQDWELDVTDLWSFRTGIDFKALDAKYLYDSELQVFSPFNQVLDNVPYLQRSFDLSPTGAQYATYLEARWQATDKLILDFGLRWDRQTYSSNDENEQRSPRINALYTVGDNSELRVGIGRFYQAQEINELQVDDGLTEFHHPQYADHFVASYVGRFRSGISLRAEYYQKDYDAPIVNFENVFDRLVLIPELQVDRARFDAKSAFVKGLEITLAGGNGNDQLSWWTSYVWSSTEERVDGTDVRRSWDQKHSVKAGLNTAWGTWDIGIAGSWHSGWPRTGLLVESVQAADGSSGLVATTTQRNSLNYPSFHTLDARASRTFQLPRSTLTMFIEISNIYNRSNPCCTRYTVEYAEDGSPGVAGDRSHWLPLIPSIGIVWEF